jgi:hypothetical protein
MEKSLGVLRRVNDSAMQNGLLDRGDVAPKLENRGTRRAPVTPPFEQSSVQWYRAKARAAWSTVADHQSLEWTWRIEEGLNSPSVAGKAPCRWSVWVSSGVADTFD